MCLKFVHFVCQKLTFSDYDIIRNIISKIFQLASVVLWKDTRLVIMRLQVQTSLRETKICILLEKFSKFFHIFKNHILPYEMYKIQTHIGFTNLWSNMPRICVISSQRVKNGTRTPCTYEQNKKCCQKVC